MIEAEQPVIPSDPSASVATPSRRAPGRKLFDIRAALRLPFLRRAVGRKAAIWLSASTLAIIWASCFFIPILGNSPDAIVGTPLSPPAPGLPFGTDDLGRDVFARAFAGGRIDITLAIAAVAFSATLGTLIGALCALASRRWIDAAVMRVIDAFLAFPYLVTVLLVVVVVGSESQVGPAPRGLTAVTVALLALGWTVYVRLARGQALSIRSRDYIVAVQLMGYSRWRILGRHVIPGLRGTVLAYAVSDAIVTMGAIASLAILGVGVQPPTAEWGSMMMQGRTYLADAWWIAAAPGLLLAATGVALSVLADAIGGDGK